MVAVSHFLLVITITLLTSTHAQGKSWKRNRSLDRRTTTNLNPTYDTATLPRSLILRPRSERCECHLDENSKTGNSNQKNNETPGLKKEEPAPQQPPTPAATPAASPAAPPNCDASVAAASAAASGQAQASASSAVESAIGSANAGIAAASQSASLGIESANQIATARILSANSSAAAVATALSTSAASVIASLSADAARLISSAQAAATSAANDASRAMQQASIAVAAATGSVGASASSLLVAASQVQAQSCSASAVATQQVTGVQAPLASETIVALQREIRGSWSAHQAAVGIIVSAIVSSVISIAIYFLMGRFISRRKQISNPPSMFNSEDDYPLDLKRKTYHPPEAVLNGRRLDSIASSGDTTELAHAVQGREAMHNFPTDVSPLRRNTYIAPISKTLRNNGKESGIPPMKYVGDPFKTEVDTPRSKFNFFGTAISMHPPQSNTITT